MTILEADGCGFGDQVHSGPRGRFAQVTRTSNFPLEEASHHNRKLIIRLVGNQHRSQLSRMCCTTGRVTQVRNVDGSFQQWRVGVMFTYMAVELTDMAMVMVCTLIEMVIFPPVKCITKTYLHGAVMVCFNRGTRGYKIIGSWLGLFVIANSNSAR